MSKMKLTKSGALIIPTQRGHIKHALTEHGQPFPNDVARPGVKAWKKAGSGGGKSRGLHGGNGGKSKRDRIAALNKSEQLSK